MGVFDGCAPSYIFRVVFNALDFQVFRLLISGTDLPQREAGSTSLVMVIEWVA